MVLVRVHDIEVDRCRSCEGIWFDMREHVHLKEIENSQRIDVGDPVSGEGFNEIRQIDCPRCQTQMVPVAFPDQLHIHYEQCSTCGGVFLDAGEFADFKELTFEERVRQFLVPFRR